MLDAALDLAARGLPVFPLHYPVRLRDGTFACSCRRQECKNQAKHPFALLAPNGFKSATTDPAQITQWWHSNPSLNIGLATGKVIVLDVDPRHHGDRHLALLEEQRDIVPHTWAVRTGSGGLHIYLAPPAGVALTNTIGRLGPGIDTRAKDGYVVAPPSLHISGRRYAWIFDPDEAPLAPMPGWLVTMLAPPPRPLAAITINAPSVAAVRGVLRMIASAHEGERNAILFWGACRLGEAVRRGLMPADTALDLLIRSAPPPDASFSRYSILLTARSGLRRGEAQ